MNDQQRSAMKMALDALEAMLTHMGMDEDEWNKPTFDQSRKAITVLREALAQPQEALEVSSGGMASSSGGMASSSGGMAQPKEPQCNQHPDAPHGFDRNASHTADRYVCECESWEPPQGEPVAWMSRLGNVLTAKYMEKYAVGIEKETHTIPLCTTPPSVEAAIKATKEKAAKMCESYIVEGIGREMAAAIRSIK